MKRMHALSAIWKNIPTTAQSPSDWEINPHLREQLERLHIGPFFYAVFNTSTTEFEKVDPHFQNVLETDSSTLDAFDYLNYVYEEDLLYYYAYKKKAVEFFSQLPVEQLFDYKFSFDYRILSARKNPKRILQQTTPLAYFPTGGARTLVTFTDITQLQLQGIPKLSFIGMGGAPSYYNVHLESGFHLRNPLLTEKELEMVHYIAKGMTSEAIAKISNRSLNTINNHRKNILQKTGCSNLTEVVVMAVREGWI